MNSAIADFATGTGQARKAQLQHDRDEVAGLFRKRLVDDRAIIIGSIVRMRLFSAEAVIDRLAESASAFGYAEIGRIAERARERFHSTGTSEAMIPYLCQLAVEIDRALAQIEVAAPPDQRSHALRTLRPGTSDNQQGPHSRKTT